MAAKAKGLDYTFNLKLSKEDRHMLNYLQDNGMNMSQYFRLKIRELYAKVEESKIMQ